MTSYFLIWTHYAAALCADWRPCCLVLVATTGVKTRLGEVCCHSVADMEAERTWRPCLSVFVCLSVCTPAYLWNDMSDLIIFCACYLWPWLGPPLATLWCVMYFRSVGWRHVCTQWPAQGYMHDKGVYSTWPTSSGVGGGVGLWHLRLPWWCTAPVQTESI